jgi:hypothetical protein
MTVVARRFVSEDRWYHDRDAADVYADASLSASDVVADRVSFGWHPDWIGPVRARLLEMLSWRRNWDGFGSAPVDPNAAERAFQLLQNSIWAGSPMPFLAGEAEGGVLIEWETPNLDIRLCIANGDRTDVTGQVSRGVGA